VDNLAQLGLTATTNAGGAGKWRKEYSAALRGANVVILPDNDEPGQGHARKVSQGLLGKAKSIKVLNLPDLPPKGDVSDWLAAGGTADQLIALAEAAPNWTPSEKEPTASTEHSEDRPTITITTEEHQVNEQAVAALGRDAGLYQRGGMLVRVVRDASPAAKGIRRPFSPRIEPLPPPLLARAAGRERAVVQGLPDKGGTEERRDRPPAWCVAAVHARADWPGVRHLEAVVDLPRAAT